MAEICPKKPAAFCPKALAVHRVSLLKQTTCLEEQICGNLPSLRGGMPWAMQRNLEDIL
jgi:hypothetical protein